MDPQLIQYEKRQFIGSAPIGSNGAKLLALDVALSAAQRNFGVNDGDSAADGCSERFLRGPN